MIIVITTFQRHGIRVRERALHVSGGYGAGLRNVCAIVGALVTADGTALFADFNYPNKLSGIKHDRYSRTCTCI